MLRGQTAKRPNREHGVDDPIGANSVTAPATVSGEGRRQTSLGNPSLGNREDGVATFGPASQETCRQADGDVSRSNYP